MDDRVPSEASDAAQAERRTLGDPEVAAHDDDTDGSTDPLQLRRGAAIGRYTVLERLGMGGMGVVYAAYDPDLDRRVAIKLLHGGALGTHATAGHQRLVREARAMAQLSH